MAIALCVGETCPVPNTSGSVPDYNVTLDIAITVPSAYRSELLTVLNDLELLLNNVGGYPAYCQQVLACINYVQNN
jgi:hypothetical protein